MLVAQPATCSVQDTSTVSRSASGIPQVSNLGSTHLRCSIAARSNPPTPASTRKGLIVSLSVYRGPGDKHLVPATVTVTGGGSTPQTEWVDFDVAIPIQGAELDAEAQRYLARLNREMKGAGGESSAFSGEDAQSAMLKGIRLLIDQNQIDVFVLEVRVNSGEQTVGKGETSYEVIFKGHFADTVGQATGPKF